MKSGSLDISDRFDDRVCADLLINTQVVAAQLAIPFFLVGATARDLLLWYGHGIRPGRATRDIDLGFRVRSWNQYDALRNALIATGDFTAVGHKQRMSYKKVTPVDLLPFGGIADAENKIRWRPDGDTELNLIGFDEAHDNSILVCINTDPLVEIRIASPAGLVLLKLFAWDDRQPGSKDADDLGILIRSYMQVANGPRIYDEHKDLLKNDPFDYEIAGAQLLGRDLAAICQDATRDRVLAILSRELSADSDLLLVSKSASSSLDIDRSRDFWEAIKHELRAHQPSPFGD